MLSFYVLTVYRKDFTTLKGNGNNAHGAWERTWNIHFGLESWELGPAHTKIMMPSAKLTEVNVHLHFAAAASALFAPSNPRPHNILWVHTFAAQAFTLPDQRMIFCHFILT